MTYTAIGITVYTLGGKVIHDADSARARYEPNKSDLWNGHFSNYGSERILWCSTELLSLQDAL